MSILHHHDRSGYPSHMPEDLQDQEREDNEPDPADLPDSQIWAPPPGRLEDRI